MNQSRITTLLITGFALAILGITAGTLHTVHPSTTYQGSTDMPGSSHADQTGERQSQSGEHAVHPLAFPSLNADQGLSNRPIQPGHILQRLAIGLTLLVLGAILVIRHLTSNDSHAEPPADEATNTPVNGYTSDAPVVPASNPSPTNDVYRAWQAMIMSLGIWENQKTPTELAQKAVRAGVPETPVTNLTALFCSVRYGENPPTEEREQCAQHALDQIQQTEQATDAESATLRDE